MLATAAVTSSYAQEIWDKASEEVGQDHPTRLILTQIVWLQGQPLLYALSYLAQDRSGPWRRMALVVSSQE